MSVSHDRLGRTQEALGNMAQARVHYQRDLEIAEELALLDPSNDGWRKDVDISRARMGRLKASR